MQATATLSCLAATLLLSIPCQADLVAHWKIDEGSGILTAESINNYNGTIAGGATWSAADLPPVPSGTAAALNLDGLDDQINVVGYKGIPGTGARTISAWIRTSHTTPQNRGIVSWGTNQTTNKWTFRIQTSNGIPGTIRVEANGGFFVGNTVITDGKWHHVAVTWENDGTPDILDSRLYVDGALDAEFGNFTTPPSASQSVAINTASSADVRIGDDFQANHNWFGGIDDVRIYNEALDARAIDSLANGTPVITSFDASAEVVASGSPLTLSWVSDPANDALQIDNGIGDVSNLTMVTINPITTTTYSLTGTRGELTDSKKVRVLVEDPPVINRFVNLGASTIIEGQSVDLYWDVFGETSISLNGTDVTGEEQLTLSPDETTTYVLRTSNNWGVTTTALTVTVLDSGSPNMGWTAAGLPAGNLALWSPHINVTGNNAIRFINTTGGTVQSGASNFSTVSQWVNSPGFNLSSNPNDSWQDGLGDLITKANVSWEMVFRPGDFVGTHVLFNTGGNGDGTAITIAGSVLDFRFQDADNSTQRLIVSKDLAAIGPATDFYHVVCLADVDSATTGTARIYVNGQLAAGPLTSTGTIDDWDGGDLAEFGKGSNIPGSTTFAHTAFTGDLALFNYYGNRLLSEQQISNAYANIAGQTAPFTITGIAYNTAQNQLIITFNSQPGRSYAIDSSEDLSSWLELDDFIPSEGNETIYTINDVKPFDPDFLTQLYRIRPVE
jgi:hypothetical protein